MPGGMYMIDAEGKFVSLTPTPFAAEADFQRLLEDHPELLTSDQMDSAIPRRWMLVAPQVGVPTDADSSAALSLDVLYVDQDAIPTLVEVKRASDTRLRREVVAQMLDYAANAVAYWPPQDLRGRFEERIAASGKEPEDELNTLGITPDQTEYFWEAVASNLRSGRIRMLFVADIVPPELRRIVEFLNEQMNPAVILALELRQFAGGGIRTFVPVVFGQTQRAVQEKKMSAPGPNLTKDAFFNELQARTGDATANIVHQIFDQAVASGYTTRSTSNSFFVRYANKEEEFIEPFAIRTSGMMEVYLHDKHMRVPFNTQENRVVS
jgi:hypothetical protein